MEVWKDIKGYEGFYQISTLGRVKSLYRIIELIDGRIRKHKERILKNNIQKNGYLTVILCDKTSQKTKHIHQLIAVNFFNHKTGYKKVVDHIDNDKKNNSISNLQIITARENVCKSLKNSASKYIGVSKARKNSKKWRSEITYKKISYYLGTFETEINAHKAYKEALQNIKKHGSTN